MSSQVLLVVCAPPDPKEHAPGVIEALQTAVAPRARARSYTLSRSLKSKYAPARQDFQSHSLSFSDPRELDHLLSRAESATATGSKEDPSLDR
jgi:hypothetical protein